MLHKVCVDLFWTVADERCKSLAVSVETTLDIPEKPRNPPIVLFRTNNRPPIYAWVMGEVFRVQ